MSVAAPTRGPRLASAGAVGRVGTLARARARVVDAAAGPVDGAGLAVLRIGVGLVAALVGARTLWLGWVEQLWLAPEVHLQWSLLAPPVPPSAVLHAEVAALVPLGLLVAAGVATRPAAWTWALLLVHLDLLDQATYLNHHVALALVALLLGCVRADRTWSLAPGRRGRGRLPRWHVWLLRAQVATVYGFAGVAKLDPDWLLRGEPLATWLAARGDVPLLGPALGLGGVAVVLSWAGLLFDGTIVWWLWWRPTRAVAVLAVVAFHAVTWLLFPGIGVFPLVMVVLASSWLPPSWPPSWPPGGARADVDAVGTGAAGAGARGADGGSAPRGWQLALVAVWAVLQVAVPLRHLAAPGDVRWNEDGGRFAWRVMAEEKVGWARFTVTAADGTTTRVGLDEVLEPWQAHVAALRPDMLVRAAHVLADRAAADGPVTVTADAHVAWNGRPAARLLDPAVDLAAIAPGAAGAATLPAPP